MRGKVIAACSSTGTDGITPAYAGKSAKTKAVALDKEDHPRLCGEKRSVLLLVALGRGSPPPMRGKGFYRSFRSFSDGITPAYAGKSDPLKLWYIDVRDHPRLCGEKAGSIGSSFCVTGSPPPMRGKGNLIGISCFCLRITPAYAGKSGSGRNFRKAVEDHPRLCGEKSEKQLIAKTAEGSPPPMRGKAEPEPAKRTSGRITPAYAGKRFCHCLFLPGSRDHPRLCGEKVNDTATKAAGTGSPPPMRGKGLWICHSTRSYRITPAYAGKSINNKT